MLRLALASRVAVVAACVAVGAYVPPYDASGTLLGQSPRDECRGAASSAVLRVLGPLASWDGAFFVDVAEGGGYAHEKQHAFFPLAPAVARLGGAVTGLCAPAAALLAAVVASQAAFCAAAVALHRLGLAVLGGSREARARARAAAVLFCVSPASVFFSAAYSESLFAALSICGCLALEHGRAAAAAVALFGAAATRSNGAALAGFPVYLALAGRVRPAPALLVAAAAVAPAFAADRHARGLYCGGEDPPPYCDAALPAAYGHVQREYWGVSLFGYYEARQAPNFALAAPALLLAALAVAAYTRAEPGRRLAWLWPRRGGRAEPYALHLAAMLLVCVTVLHVQVSTRFLAACPALYWHAAALASRGGRPAAALVAYHLAYAALGCALFSSFYPWT